MSVRPTGYLVSGKVRGYTIVALTTLYVLVIGAVCDTRASQITAERFTFYLWFIYTRCKTRTALLLLSTYYQYCCTNDSSSDWRALYTAVVTPHVHMSASHHAHQHDTAVSPTTPPSASATPTGRYACLQPLASAATSYLVHNRVLIVVYAGMHRLSVGVPSGTTL